MFALTVAGDLGLSDEQIASVRNMGMPSTLHLAKQLGFPEITEDPTRFYLQPESKWKQSFARLTDLNEKQEANERSSLDKIFNEQQRKMFRELHFRHLVTKGRLDHVLLSIGITDLTDKQRKAFRKIVAKTHGQRESRVSQFLDLASDEWPRAKFDFGIRSGDPPFLSLYYFGASHDRLSETDPPKPGTKCKICDEVIDGGTGYTYGRRSYHESCFVNHLIRPVDAKAQKKNPRRESHVRTERHAETRP